MASVAEGKERRGEFSSCSPGQWNVAPADFVVGGPWAPTVGSGSGGDAGTPKLRKRRRRQQPEAKP